MYDNILIWTPRLLAMLYALFLSLFALDVFSEGYGPGETILALLIHLIPTYLVIIALVVAWSRETTGAMLFVVLGLFSLVMISGGAWMISGPLFLIGALFLFSGFYRKKQAAI